MYNISGEDLFFKWEAVRYGTKGPQQFTADSVQALKARMQRDVAKANVKRQQAKVTLSGSLNRRFGSAQKPGPRMDTSAMRAPQQPAVRRQDGFAFGASEDKIPVAGPSRVRFVGQDMDEESRKRRACQCMSTSCSVRALIPDRPVYV